MRRILKQIPSNMVVYRRMQNLTQAELGNLIGKTQSQISMIETGQVDIATEELERIANILNYKGEPRRLLDAYASVAA